METASVVVAFVAALAATFCIFMLIRNQVVYSVRWRAIDYIYAQKNWLELLNRLRNPDYDQMLFQFTKWTFRQFYPDFK